MKSIRKMMLIMAIALSCGVYSSNAQVIVRVRPERPRIERIEAPTPRHVWIDDDWQLRNGAYQFVCRRWVLPPEEVERWIPGHWRERGDGWVWIPGHWR